jgi:hypothetical protein
LIFRQPLFATANHFVETSAWGSDYRVKPASLCPRTNVLRRSRKPRPSSFCKACRETSSQKARYSSKSGDIRQVQTIPLIRCCSREDESAAIHRPTLSNKNELAEAYDSRLCSSRTVRSTSEYSYRCFSFASRRVA